jgi:hypothetical protein
MIINQLAKATVDLGGRFSPERVKYSLEMTLLGLLAVFSVLALIWAVLALFKIFMYDMPNKRKSENNGSKTNQPVAPMQINVEETGASVTPVANNDATVAAIIAAISAYITSDPQLSQEYSGGFRVVSFKRVRDKASWNSKK